MRIAIIGDVHWSKTSSILTRRGISFSMRLENLIDTINWCEETADSQNCDKVIYLGDFFDRSDLNAEEISALKTVKWNELPHHFIVGNHESGIHTLVYNSTDVLNKPNFKIEYKPTTYELEDENTDLYILPYFIEDNRKELKDYLKGYDSSKKNIIFSHNDLKGIKYGAFESKEGFSLNEIEECCDLFINGHLHNGTWVTKKILNLGNITGQNFTEDAFNYKHQIAILDTNTLKIDFIENPYAFNFYKIDINSKSDLNKIDSLKNNAVVSFKCLDKYVEDLKEKLNTTHNICESKTVIHREFEEKQEEKVELNNSNYLTQFISFIHDKLGKSDVVEHELGEVCK